jgi:hypothetical protein
MNVCVCVCVCVCVRVCVSLRGHACVDFAFHPEICVAMSMHVRAHALWLANRMHSLSMESCLCYVSLPAQPYVPNTQFQWRVHLSSHGTYRAGFLLGRDGGPLVRNVLVLLGAFGIIFTCAWIFPDKVQFFYNRAADLFATLFEWVIAPLMAHGFGWLVIMLPCGWVGYCRLPCRATLTAFIDTQKAHARKIGPFSMRLFVVFLVTIIFMVVTIVYVSNRPLSS